MPGFGKTFFIAILVFGLSARSLAIVGEVSDSEDTKLNSLFPGVISLAVSVQNAAIASMPQTPQIVFKRLPINAPKRSPVVAAPTNEIEPTVETNMPVISTPTVSGSGSSYSGPVIAASSPANSSVSSTPIGEVSAGTVRRDTNAIEPATLPGNSGALLSTVGSFGGLPIPMAQVAPGSYIQNSRPWGPDAEQFSDLVGSAGSSFGKSRADGTFDSLRERAKNKSDSVTASDQSKNKKLTPEEKKKKAEEEKKKEEEKLAKMEENMEKLEQGITPFDNDAYLAYQEARDQFFREDPQGELLGGLLKGKDEVAEKMVNLFNKNGRMDEDTFQTNGKESFQRFVDSRNGTNAFPSTVVRPGGPLHNPTRH